MRIVVDMQPAQRDLMRVAPPDNFGLQLAQWLVRTGREHEIVLLVSSLHPEALDPLREWFRGAPGEGSIRFWGSVPCRDFSPQPWNWPLTAARLMKQAAVEALRPDVFVVPVPARRELGDHAAVPVFPARVCTLAITEQAHDAALPALLAACGFGAATGRSQAPARHARIGATLAQLRGSERSGGGLWAAATRLVQDDVEAVTVRSDDAKPRLAWVSPLPPAHSGIADYSAVLLPGLSRHYEIDVVTSQPAIADAWITAHCRALTPEQFRQEHARYDRVLYHFGNSSFHDYMFDLLADIPGVVVLHDFFLGDIQLIREQQGLAPHAWARSLFAAHGYGALMERFDQAQLRPTLSRYPANIDVIQQAQGVIVHSQHARRLADDCYGAALAREWAVIPLARAAQAPADRAAARERLGLGAQDFIVCSLGFINPMKLHDRIVAAWSHSALAADVRCRLLFVGGSDDAFGAALRSAIDAAGAAGQVRVTGWVDGAAYHDFIAAADVCVQLRTQSRGETSAAVLDCMSHERATIVNANGSMADLPQDAVWMLPDEFTDAQLTIALETLWRDASFRARLGSRARQLIQQHHAPDVCGLQYAAAIEKFAARAPEPLADVARALGRAAGPQASDHEFAALALALTRARPLAAPARQLLVDVSAIARTDLKTGIQRVVRALVWEFIKAPPAGYRIEPVCMTSEGNAWHYRYARAWTSAMLGIPTDWAPDEVAEFAAGDILLVADFTAGYVVEAERMGMFEQLRNAGVKITYTIYDLLPLQLPDMFPPGARDTHAAWFAAVARSGDGVICISRSVADEVRRQLPAVVPSRATPLQVDWFHLGADLDGSIPSGGVPEGAAQVLAALAGRPSFLMVGTVEPRKGHADALAGFEQLWAHGAQVNLVIAGKRGWMVDELCQRLRDHPEAGQRLFWIEDASDEYLRRIYEASRCLIAASQGEGFGLPLIEAAQHGLPIIARDIPVFREVAGEYATYFSGQGEAIAGCVREWLRQSEAGAAPQSNAMPWLTWRQSAQRVLQCLGLQPAGPGGGMASGLEQQAVATDG